MPWVGSQDFDECMQNHTVGQWRYWKSHHKMQPTVIVYPTTMTRVPEELDQWESFKSDAHFPVSFKLAPPPVRKFMEQSTDLTLSAIFADTFGDDAVSLVAEILRKPAQLPPPPLKGPPEKRRRLGTPSPSRAPGPSGSQRTKSPQLRSKYPAKQAPLQSPAEKQAASSCEAVQHRPPPPPQPMEVPALRPRPPPLCGTVAQASQQPSLRSSPVASRSAEPAAGPRGPQVVEPRTPAAVCIEPTNVEIAATDIKIKANGIPVSWESKILCHRV